MDRLLFSSMLRKRTKWHLLQESFSKAQGIEITEMINADLDLCLEKTVSKRKVVANLMDSSTIVHNQGPTLNDWTSRITPEVHVVLLLPADDPGQQALALQMLQLHLLSLQAAVFVVPISHIDQVLSALMAYTTCNGGSGSSDTREVSSMEVIPYATSSAPRILLSAAEVYTIQQICGSITGLEHYTRSREGQNRLAEYLDQELVNSMVEFWKDEWII